MKVIIHEMKVIKKNHTQNESSDEYECISKESNAKCFVCQNSFGKQNIWCAIWYMLTKCT